MYLAPLYGYLFRATLLMLKNKTCRIFITYVHNAYQCKIVGAFRCICDNLALRKQVALIIAHRHHDILLSRRVNCNSIKGSGLPVVFPFSAISPIVFNGCQGWRGIIRASERGPDELGRWRQCRLSWLMASAAISVSCANKLHCLELISSRPRCGKGWTDGHMPGARPVYNWRQ